MQWIVSTECSEDDGSKDVIEKEIVWWPGKILMTEKEERDSKGRRVYEVS